MEQILSFLENNLSNLYIPRPGIIDIFEIIIISIMIYHILIWMRNTRAWSLMKGIVSIMVMFVIAVVLEMNTIIWIAQNVVYLGVIAVIVILQPELRKALETLGKELNKPFNIEIKIENQETILYMNNQKIDEEVLQSKDASLAVSEIGGSADNKNLFIFAKKLVNDLKEKYHVILSGRSVMKIYPDCDYHFFVVASLEERVRRKCIQYGNKEKEKDAT